MGVLSRLTRRLVPADWRASVERDLAEEASRRALTNAGADFWIAWHALRIGAGLRWHRGRTAAGLGGTSVLRVDDRVVLGADRGRHLRATLTITRDAWRALRSSRAVTAFSVLILTGAIAASTVTFSIVDAVLLRALPIDDSERLVIVSRRGGGAVSGTGFDQVVSFTHFDAWRRQADAFESLAAGQGGPMAQFIAGTRVTEARAWQTTASLFEALRVKPAHGRLFTAENEAVGRDAVALIGHRFWLEAFGGSLDVIGQSLRLVYRAEDAPAFVTVVGVMPAGFTYPLDGHADVWIPHASGSPYTPGPHSGYLRTVGRLRAGVTSEQARTQLQDITAATAAAHGLTLRDGWQPVVTKLLDSLVGPRKGSMLLVLWASILLMLVACVNVANLLLSRSAERARELSLRASLGASPAQLALTLLAESLVLSLMAAGLAVLLAFSGLDVTKAALPANLFRADTIALDLRVLSFATAAAVAAGLLFGVIPAWTVARAQPAALLGGGTSAATPGHRRWRTTLVTAEVALVGALLVVSTLFVGSFMRIVDADLGFSRRNLVGFSLEAFKDPTMPILEVLRHTAGVGSVAEWAGPPPLLTRGGATMLLGLKAGEHAHEPGEILAARYRVSPGYFETAGIPLVRGRTFTEADAQSPVAIIDELAASVLFFDGRDALGADLSLGARSPLHTIVGIVRTVRREGPERDSGTQLYLPRATGTPGATRFLVKTSAPVSDVMPVIQQSLQHALPAGTPVPRLHSLDEAFRTMTAGRRANATIMALFGLIVLLIGGAGVYAVMASTVAQQQRELGVRVALGATRGRIIRGVLGRAVLFLTVGLAMGLAAGRALSTLFAAMLFEVRPGDASTYVIVAALLMSAGLVAALRPALRAGRVDPLRTLKEL